MPFPSFCFQLSQGIGLCVLLSTQYEARLKSAPQRAPCRMRGQVHTLVSFLPSPSHPPKPQSHPYEKNHGPRLSSCADELTWVEGLMWVQWNCFSHLHKCDCSQFVLLWHCLYFSLNSGFLFKVLILSLNPCSCGGKRAKASNCNFADSLHHVF